MKALLTSLYCPNDCDRKIVNIGSVEMPMGLQTELWTGKLSSTSYFDTYRNVEKTMSFGRDVVAWSGVDKTYGKSLLKESTPLKLAKIIGDTTDRIFDLMQSARLDAAEHKTLNDVCLKDE